MGIRSKAQLAAEILELRRLALDIAMELREHSRISKRQFDNATCLKFEGLGDVLDDCACDFEEVADEIREWLPSLKLVGAES